MDTLNVTGDVNAAIDRLVGASENQSIPALLGFAAFFGDPGSGSILVCRRFQVNMFNMI